MRRIIYCLIWFILCMPILCAALTISDVSVADPAYPAIQQSIRDGYLKLNNQGQFLPSQEVDRKEIALIIDKLKQGQSSGNSTLTKAQIEELENLANKFKGYLVDYEKKSAQTNNELQDITQVQKVINNDISKVNENLTKELENQKVTMAIWGFTIVVLAIIL